MLDTELLTEFYINYIIFNLDKIKSIYILNTSLKID